MYEKENDAKYEANTSNSDVCYSKEWVLSTEDGRSWEYDILFSFELDHFKILKRETILNLKYWQAHVSGTN